MVLDESPHFHIESQTRKYSIIEDFANKKWRPIPSRRIDVLSARWLRLWVIVFSFIVSLWHGVPTLQASLLLWGFIYNNTTVHRSALARNSVCAVAYGIMGVGADIVALQSYKRVQISGTGLSWAEAYVWNWKEIDETNLYWFAILCAVIFSTMHVSDIPDMKGDDRLGRKTLPIILGLEKCNKITACVVMGWSFIMALTNLAPAPVFAFGILVAGMAICHSLLLVQESSQPKRIEQAYRCYKFLIAAPE